jgi:hypothetical protein
MLILGVVFVALLAVSPLLIRAVWDTSDEYAVIVGDSAVVWVAVMIGAVWMLNSTEPRPAPPRPPPPG